MGDFVSDGTEFSCPLCTSKLKIAVPSSSAEGDSKAIANTGNFMFPPPPGAQCLLVPSAPAPCAPPNVSVMDPGQSSLEVDGKKALGSGCMLQCAKSGLLSVASSGQSSAQHGGGESGAAAVMAEVAIASMQAANDSNFEKKDNERPASALAGSKRDQHKNAPYQQTRNKRADIEGRSYSGHALDQMQNRGIPSSVSQHTIKHGQPSQATVKGKTMTHYYDKTNNVTVVCNEKGGVVSVGHGKIGRKVIK
ncbi:MAG: DUF4280 domain-containing protein [Verrucomicrobia bacterium]|nr:DUF4280 domain-containing protein [Verrucomicrobiota bacterium]